MKLNVEWDKPLVLRDGRGLGLIYGVDLAKVPKLPGIYVLGRQWGRDFEALYVGKAGSIRGRLKGQLNNLRLMQHLKAAKTGKRIVLLGRFRARPGQRVEKSLLLVERTLIRHFLSEGHDLVNKQGTKIRRHEVWSSGKHPKRYVPRTMFLEG